MSIMTLLIALFSICWITAAVLWGYMIGRALLAEAEQERQQSNST